MKLSDELELTLSAGKVTSETSTSAPFVDEGALACVTDALKTSTFPSRSGSVRYRAEVDVNETTGGSGVKMLEIAPTIPKGLPPAVIKRVVRATFPRFRACHQQG